MAISYSTLVPTVERGAICANCHDYKGMVDCTDVDCGGLICVFCDPWCPDCGEEIDFSS